MSEACDMCVHWSRYDEAPLRTAVSHCEYGRCAVRRLTRHKGDWCNRFEEEADDDGV